MRPTFFDPDEVTGLDELANLTLHTLFHAFAQNALFSAVEWSLGDGRFLLLRRLTAEGMFYFKVKWRKL